MATTEQASDLTCAVCLERLRHPKILPCYHTFCKRCVEKVAGGKPSFPCPTCRTVILLPPGGAKELQTNVYLEKDLARAMAEGGAECELCTSGKPAVVKCVQCQQLYCQPCKQTHDSIPACSDHSVLPLGEAAAAAEKTSATEEKPPKSCPKHKTQPLIFFCRECDVTICMHCKLTSHEGHETQDVEDSGQQARAELTERLVGLAEQENALKALLSQSEDFRAELDKEKRELERELGARSERLTSLVTQQLEKSKRKLSSMASSLQNDLKQQAQPIQMNLEAVHAKHQHIQRVLDGADDCDILDLLQRLKTDESTEPLASKGPGLAMTVSKTSVALRFDDNAITKADISAYIGTPGEGQSAEMRAESATTISVQEIAKVERIARPSLNEREKPLAKEIVYSKNQKVLMTDMVLAAEEKMWVLFHFDNFETRMALFDSRARRLEHHYESMSGKLACEGDTLVVIPDGKSASPGGKFGHLGKMEFDTQYGWLLSRPCPSYYILKRQKVTQYREQQQQMNPMHYTRGVPTQRVSYDVAGAADIVRIASLTSSPPKLEVEALCSGIQQGTAVAEYSTSASTFAVSADEKFLAFLHQGGVTVFLIDAEDSSKLKTVAQYKMEKEIIDLVFSPVGGKELLIVACHDDNAVLVLDHEDGCCRVRALQSDQRPITRPFRLAVNGKGRLWVGCHGGKILIFDLCVEKVAGGKPSFPCPTCSTVIILPPGGAKELQTNVDLEKNLARAMAEGGAECELCTSGKPAVVKCVQCQQLYCQPCKQTHDSITSCSDHSVLPLGEVAAAAAEKTCAKEIVYSKNQKVLMTDMVLAAEEKMWVLFRFEDTDTRMALFDSRARRLEHHYESLSGKLACEGDTLVVIPGGKSASPGGKFLELGSMKFDTNFGWLLSRPCPRYYILKRQKVTEFEREFENGRLVTNEYIEAGAADIVCFASLTSSPPQLESKALCSHIPRYAEVSKYSSNASTFAVSTDERFLAFLHQGDVTVYLIDPKDSSKLKTVAQYKNEAQKEIVDLVFSPVGGKEQLIVACHDDNAVIVLDHEDGCCLVRALQSDQRPITKPFRLTVNGKGRLWVGCHGGKILIFDL